MTTEPTERTDAPVVIYLLRNTVNGKCYVGKTEDFDDRIRRYATGQGHCLIGRAVEKHEWETFDVYVLERTTRSAGPTTERRWIAALDCIAPNGYNLRDGGEGGRHSERSRQKQSATQTAKGARGELPQQCESPDKKSARYAKSSATHKARWARGEHWSQSETPEERDARIAKQSATRREQAANGMLSSQRDDVRASNSNGQLRRHARDSYEDAVDAGQQYAVDLPLVEVDRSHKRSRTTYYNQRYKRIQDTPDNGETQLTLL